MDHAVFQGKVRQALKVQTQLENLHNKICRLQEESATLLNSIRQDLVMLGVDPILVKIGRETWIVTLSPTRNKVEPVEIKKAVIVQGK